jgi:hypothetical protein
MYGGKGGGAASLTGGAILLPNTGGHIVLTIVALTSITIGSLILISVFGRYVAKRIYS